MSDSNRFRGGSAAALVVILASALFTSSAAADTINFDTDANGNPLSVPSGFASTTRLTELYASLGVHFAGPGGNDGGAILHQDGNFGLAARSGTNFLAFNRTAPMADGGIPTDPETITFDNPMSVVSIYAAGGHTTDSFLMEAYDASNVLVASDTVISQGFAELSAGAGLGISRVVLTQTGDHAFVYDDLSFTPVPEPTGALALLAGVAIAALRRGRVTGGRQ